MLDESNDLNPETPEQPQPSGGSGNRTFLIVGGILGALILLTLAAGAAYVFWLGPNLAAQKSAAQATIQAQNTLIAEQETATAVAAATLAAPTVEPPTATPTPTDTAVVQTPAASPTLVVAIATSTVSAETQTAVQALVDEANQLTATAQGTSSASAAMPTTGFFDQVGLPSLIALAAVLIVVIFLARRLRRSPK